MGLMSILLQRLSGEETGGDRRCPGVWRCKLLPTDPCFGTPSSMMQLCLFDVRYPWTEQLMNGKKTIETREYPLPSRYLHQTLALYETHVEVKDDQVEDDQVEEDHQRDDCCVGLIQFCSCKEYTSKEQWSKDSDKHGVPFDATPEEFGWVDGIQKYGWKVSYVEKTKKKKLPQRFERHFRSFFTVHQW